MTCFRIFDFILLACCLTFINCCQPPDTPVGGSFKPYKLKYLPGDKVVYTCNKNFIRIGRETRTCGNGDRWSDSTPFCDSSSKLKNPLATSNGLSSANFAIDGDPDTCFASHKATGQNLKVFLDNPAPIHAIRMYLPKGEIKIKIHTSYRGVPSQQMCAFFNRNIESAQWALIECNENTTSDAFHIHDNSPVASVLKICELEVYVKDDDWCEDAPGDFIPNGWLEVDRGKASLMCADGYKPGDLLRLICNNNKWSRGVLRCNEILCDKSVNNLSNRGGDWHLTGKVNRISIGTEKKLICERGYKIAGKPDSVSCTINGTWTKTTATCVEKKPVNNSSFKTTIIIVSSVVVLIILSCFGILLFLVLKKRSKQVVVVLKPDDNGYNQSSSNNTEAEYSTVAYDYTNFATPTPSVRKTPPNLYDGYARPHDTWSPSRSHPQIKSGPAYVNAQTTFGSNELRPNENFTFGTLKASTLYGS